MCEYLNSLQETIEIEAAQVLEDTLSQQLTRDLADQIAQAVIESERHDFRQVLYLLIDGETGQLESRKLYESYAEAEKAIKEPQHGYLNQSLIATLLCDR